MTKSRGQINRSGVTLQRPSDRDPGEMYVNYADKQLGVIKGDKSPLDMLPVRYFSDEANYQPNDYVINGAIIYRAKAGISAGPFDPAAWDVMTAILEAPTDGKIYGRSSATWTETITKIQFDSQISGLDTRVSATEAKNSEQDGRLTAIEGVNTAQGTNITTINADQITQNNRLTAVETKNTQQDTDISSKANIASPTFTGDPKAPTPAAADNDTSIATTAFVKTALNTFGTAQDTRDDAQDAAIALRLTDAPSDGLVYGRKNAAWSTVIGGAHTDDSPPSAPLQDGQLWWKSSTGAMFIWYDDGNSQQWVQVAGTLESPYPLVRATAQARNRIVNGAFQITQEFAKSVAQAANNTFIADQWMAYFATGGVPNFAVVASHSEEPDVVWWLRLGSGATPDTSIATADFYSIAQYIEGINIADFKWGTANARPALLRFKAWSNIAGTFCVAVRTPAVGRSFVKECVIAANTVTEYVIPIPASTTGTWPTDNNAGLRVNFTVMAGTTYNGGTDNQWVDASWIATPQCSNWMSAAGQYLDIANVGLYLDPDNTGLPPQWQMPDEAEELRACERYYEKSYQISANPGTAGQIAGMTYINAHATAVKYSIRFSTRKRIPTVAMAGYSYVTGASGVYRDVTANVDRAVTLSAGTGETTFTADFPGTAIGSNIALQWVANARM